MNGRAGDELVCEPFVVSVVKVGSWIRMTTLVLGPVLRYVGETEATVWVETDAECVVTVLGGSDQTFSIGGHHYALVHVTGLEPGETRPYEVELDGKRAWPPPDYDFPAPVIRTRADGDPVRILFGSCRVSLPHHEPYTLSKDDHPDGRGNDALHTLAQRLPDAPREDWPELLLMLGDQVYVDEGSPAVRERIRATRDTSDPPGDEVANFEEYTWLYHESWSEPVIRWLLSTVPSAMVIDDHDMADDWNISLSWKQEMNQEPWWRERLAGGLMSYWVYQHIGNLAPAELSARDEYQQVRSAPDGTHYLRKFVEWVDGTGEGTVWSFARDLGSTRLIVADDRTGRHFREDHRSIVDEHEWDWIQRQARGEFDHVVLATTDPVLLAPGLHYLEAWSEAVCDGAWGRGAVRRVESVRRALDLDHWASFQVSFRLIERLLRELGSGERGSPPASITMVSGDVHHAYLAEVAFRRDAGVRSAVHQAVCSPFRNGLDSRERRMMRFATSKAGERIGRALARTAGAQDPDIRWRLSEGPYFDNQAATLTLQGRAATLKLEKTAGDPADVRSLETVFERRLA